jgi:hypothetical protein
MRILGGAAFAFLSFPVTMVGAQILWLGLRTRVGHPFYVQHGYLEHGFIWVGWGILILFFGILPVLRCKSSVSSWFLAAILLFAAAVAIPSNVRPEDTARSAESGVRFALSRTTTALAAQSVNAGRLPANQTESDHIVSESGMVEAERVTRYRRDGQPLSLRWAFVGGSAGPRLALGPGTDPGIIYCAVSLDQKKVWLTATVLDGPASQSVILLPASGGSGPQIEQYSLEAPQPQ